MKKSIAARVLTGVLLFTLLAGAALPCALGEEVWNNAPLEALVPEQGEFALLENAETGLPQAEVPTGELESSPVISTPETDPEPVPALPGETTPETPGETTPEVPGETTPEMPGETTPEVPRRNDA